ncbi:hypothetical protein ABKN59_006230 [Abortiporus biennis]
MATTTEILHNSPALHSLKRDQLVKLCKLHQLKANGKNVELIERLKEHAKQLPPHLDDGDKENQDDQDEEMSDDQDTVFKPDMARPSEQWEVVMEDIEEVDEPASRNATMTSMKSGMKTSAGEFGTNSSKTSVTSSIRALASSLGIKRALSTSKSNGSIASSSSMPASRDNELDKYARPYSALPPSQDPPLTDHFKFSTPDASMVTDKDDDSMSKPVPGDPSRPGIPAPPNARLSTGEGLTTTVRLVSIPNMTSENLMSPPKLPAFQTSFDIVMSPGGASSSNVWPPNSPGTTPAIPGRLYPAVPREDYASFSSLANKHSKIPTINFDSPAPPSTKKINLPSNVPQDIFSPMRPPASSRNKPKESLPRSEPFLFGSPLPQHRLSNHDFGQAAASVLEEMNKRLVEQGVKPVDKDILQKQNSDVFGSAINPASKPAPVADRFAKAHEAAFNKMDSITNHYAAKRGPPASKKRKSDVLGHGPTPGAKRKSSVASHTGTRVISNGVRKNMGIPGGFGDDEEEEEEEDPADRRSSKRIRIAENQDIHKGKRVSLAPTTVPEKSTEELEKDERRRSALKKKIEARRRSSRGRASLGKAAIHVKAKPSRFGFLSSAKSLVKNVWNMGAGGSSTKHAPPSNIPVPKAALKPAPPPTVAAPKPPSIGLGPPPVQNLKHPGTNRVSSSNSLLKPEVRPRTASAATANTTASNSSRSRSPIPSFSPQTGRANSVTANTAGSRMSTAASRARNSSLTGASSMGARTSIHPQTAASSMGTRKSSGNALNTGPSPPSKAQFKRPSSTLLAPTASSLAKRTSIASARKSNPLSSPSNHAPSSPQSPRGKIFSKPVNSGTFGVLSPSSIPTPIRDAQAMPSLTTAAANLMNITSPVPSSVPPKPRALIAKKPRISRSKVIAKLGDKRVASASGSSQAAGLTSPKAVKSGKVRSSVGNGVRKSAGGRSSMGGKDTVVMSAKKRIRKSEFARRQSAAVAGRAANAGPSRRSLGVGLGNRMDVDDD